MSDYPVPRYAAYVWVTGDTLWLGFPSPVEGGSHSVPFPATDKGLKLAMSTLRERETSTRLEIANKAAPSRYQVERALVNDKRYNELLRALKVAPKVDPEVEALMRELGL